MIQGSIPLPLWKLNNFNKKLIVIVVLLSKNQKLLNWRL